MVSRVQPALGDGDVAGRLDEAGERRVGDLVPIDPEALDRDLVRGALLGLLAVIAHGETAALDPHHPGVRAVAFGQAGITIAQRGRRDLAGLQGVRKDQEGGHARADHRAGVAPRTAHRSPSGKTVFQSFFMLITVQPRSLSPRL